MWSDVGQSALGGLVLGADNVRSVGKEKGSSATYAWEGRSVFYGTGCAPVSVMAQRMPPGNKLPKLFSVQALARWLVVTSLISQVSNCTGLLACQCQG